MDRRSRAGHIVSALLIIAVLGGAFNLPRTVRADEPAARDVIILLDVTRSMKGEGGGDIKDIWQDVQARVEEQIDALSDGTSLAIVPFAAGADRANIWPMPETDEAAPLQFATLDAGLRQQAKATVDNLDPTGVSTEICRSLDYALQ